MQVNNILIIFLYFLKVVFLYVCNFQLTKVLSAPLKDDNHLVAVGSTSLKRTLECQITIITCIHATNTCNVLKLVHLGEWTRMCENIWNHLQNQFAKEPDFASRWASYSLNCYTRLAPGHFNQSARHTAKLKFRSLAFTCVSVGCCCCCIQAWRVFIKFNQSVEYNMLA